MSATPIVLVSSDNRVFDHVRWHATPAQYLEAVLYGSGAIPLMLPSLGGALDLETILDRVDGVLLTGSRSNVHPSLYGVEPDVKYEPYDEARDATTLPLIRLAIARGKPLLAICRGYQELNVALGGSLHTEIQEFDGRMDHRAPISDHQDERYAIRHRIEIVPGSCIGRIMESDEIAVNSLHRQGIAELSPRLAIEATAPDGTIEAVRVADAAGFAVGVQWHPEYWVGSDNASSRLFQAFGAAVRAEAAARLPQPLAAE
ncbi:gamma-glutamyl-gamma-aminobutyrate hydrolase family protein [Prosthecodimorpha staleyi]|uniref:gamma-glutamyl-gamma-aminobutyrate hydrolase n=1 Tax=Prosthecodimorpha staleyi TaxID=2840188 RepID=A0A947GC26_9HYPH|nr:gamma-glutamyl-gamma-aminobutyrate hydrolase family protein [Prosthecodimorpha staleyi]MBT9289307.1 gamma-glutamyl-gamma-aminobutyrate hydrolase family protein [Prosthecodimorpha staleyi]